MRIRYIFLLILSLVMLIFSINLFHDVSGFDRGNNLFNVSFDITNISGRSYTPDCLTNCHLPIKVRYDGSLVPSTISLSAQNFNYYFKFQNRTPNNIKIEYLNITQINVTDYKNICTLIPSIRINDTININNCVNSIVGSHLENISEWVSLPSLINLRKGQDYYFDLVGKFQAGLGRKEIDIVPSARISNLQFNMTEFAWWNTSWGKRKEINITGGANNLTNFTVLINVTYDSDMSGNFTDLRFIDGTCAGTQDTQLYHEFDMRYNGTEALIWVKIPILNASNLQNTSICMYYNNTPVSNGEDSINAWDQYYSGVWHFTEASGDAINSVNSTTNASAYITGGKIIPSRNTLFGRGRHLPGDTVNGGWFRINDTSSRFTNNTNFTVEVFFNLIDSGADNPIVFHADNDVPVDDYAFLTTADDNLYAEVSSACGGAGRIQQDFTTIRINRSVNSYFAMTWQASQAITAFNNTVSAVSTGSQAGMCTADAPMFFGSNHDSVDVTNITLDEIRISNIIRDSAWINRTIANSNQTLFNIGDEQSVDVLTTLNTPNNGQQFNVTAVTLNCSANGNGNALVNISFYVDGLLNSTTTTTLLQDNITRTLNFSDAGHNWTCLGQTAATNNMPANRTISC